MPTINKRPSGKWQATVRSGGKSASKTLTKKADAIKWARKIEMHAEAGGSLRPTKRTDKQTVADALEMFRDSVVPQHRSADREQRCIDALLKHQRSLCRIRLDMLTSEDVCRWRDKRLTEVSPGTVVRELTLFQSALAHALTEDAPNVVKSVKRPRVNDRRERILSEREWAALLAAASDCRNKLMRPLLVLARETAMRRGELLSMQWRNVDLERCTVFLPKTKNGHAREVPLSPTAVEVLAGLRHAKHHDEFVLPITENAVRLAWDRLRLRADVKDIRLHDLRAQAATDRLLEGWSVAEVQVQTGHRSASVLLERYARIKASHIVDKMRSTAPNKRATA